MLFHLLAHSSDSHANSAEAITHHLSWQLQIILFALIIISILAISLRSGDKSKDRTIIIVPSVLLVLGASMYVIAPILSLVFITFGVLAVVFATLLGISK
jgi:membrane protein CcdC involved in cytochrome C biogenesis